MKGKPRSIDLRQPAPLVAAQLLGWELRFGPPGDERGGVIVETEAYTADDPASHSFRGPSPRNSPMFQPAGTVYIYLIYGLHYCLNIVTGQSDGQAVLIRALRPTTGIASMRRRRGAVADRQLANGPAKLVQAMGIPATLNGYPLNSTGLRLIPPQESVQVKVGQRIGISRGTDKLWRFYLS